jgi:dihydroxy-acid dehydratase
MNARKKPTDLRSHRWFGNNDMRSFGHHSRTSQMGYSRADYQGKPIIAIVNTWSDINACHSHFRQRAEEVKRGVLQAGGFPLEMPAIALAEVFQKPTTMLYRNLLAMETEELLRSYPVDGAVLMGGCDKTTPAMLMGAISMNLPAIFMPAGPMLSGHWRDQKLGSGSDVWKFWAEKRAGNITDAQWSEIEDGIARSPGHCMTMGTASTMTSAAEAMGFTLPGAASIPAADSRHGRMATETGRRIVEMVWEDLKPRDFLDAASIDNAVTTVLSLGGSTNSVVHMVAVARRAGIPLTIDRFDAIARKTPLIANLRPAGKFLDGRLFLRRRLARAVERDRRPVDAVGAHGEWQDARREHRGRRGVQPRRDPAARQGACGLRQPRVLRGNLAPDGAVIKPAAAETQLLRHTGPAVVFADYNDMAARIDDPALPVTKDSVLVLQHAGPLGAPGMPEWGQLPIPRNCWRKVCATWCAFPTRA